MVRRALSFTGAGIDRSALVLMEKMWLLDGDPNSALRQERQSNAFDIYTCSELKADPRSFFKAPPPAEISGDIIRRIKGGCIERIRWPSNYKTWDPSFQPAYDRFHANKTAHAEWFRHTGRNRPTIICIHSWATGNYQLQRHVFGVRKLYQAGLDVVMFMLPFHGPRRSSSSRYGGQHFPGTDPQRTNEAWGQVVWDIRSLIGFLGEHGRSTIGVMGMSLGGYATALLAGIEPQLSFAVPMIPMVSYPDILWFHGRKSKMRKKAEERGVTLEQLRELNAVHSPLTHTPLLDPNRLMIIAGRGDRICTPEHVQMLWEHWKQPLLHWFSGSHIAHFGRRSAFRRLCKFLESHQVI